jgi:phosphoglycerate kinase
MVAMIAVTATGPLVGGQRIPVLEDLPDPRGKRVLVRATFDRPLSTDPGQPLALHRAQGLAATVAWLLTNGSRITVCGSFGESGDTDPAPVLEGARRVIGALGPDAAAPGSVEFRPSPEDPGDLDRLVEGHDLFVNDTLQDSFLPLPSLTVPPSRLPSAAGRTLQQDLEIMEGLMVDPARPFVAVLGGERSFDRLHGLTGLVLRADVVLLGGALALPMLRAVGKLPHDDATEALAWECRSIIGISRRVRHEIRLPDDLVWRQPDGSLHVTAADVPGGDDVVDIGPVTRIRFAEMLAHAGSTLWAGSLGMVESPECTAGTAALAGSVPAGATIVYGGDALVTSLAAAHLLPDGARMLSATDAAVELLKDGDLPALAALRRR